MHYKNTPGTVGGEGRACCNSMLLPPPFVWLPPPATGLLPTQEPRPRSGARGGGGGGGGGGDELTRSAPRAHVLHTLQDPPSMGDRVRQRDPWNYDTRHVSSPHSNSALPGGALSKCAPRHTCSMGDSSGCFSPDVSTGSCSSRRNSVRSCSSAGIASSVTDSSRSITSSLGSSSSSSNRSKGRASKSGERRQGNATHSVIGVFCTLLEKATTHSELLSVLRRMPPASAGATRERQREASAASDHPSPLAKTN